MLITQAEHSCLNTISEVKQALELGLVTYDGWNKDHSPIVDSDCKCECRTPMDTSRMTSRAPCKRSHSILEACGGNAQTVNNLPTPTQLVSDTLRKSSSSRANILNKNQWSSSIQHPFEISEFPGEARAFLQTACDFEGKKKKQFPRWFWWMPLV